MEDKFHYTSIETFQSCDRKYKFSELFNWKPDIMKTAPSFGIAMHEGLARRPEGLSVAVQSFEKSHREMIPKIPENDIRTIEKGKNLLAAYWERYPIDPWKTLKVELGFALDFDEFVYYGRIDKIVEFQGQIDIVDHKTTRDFGPTFFQRFSPDRQLIGYLVAASEYYENVGGAWIDAIQVAKTKSDMGRHRYTYRSSVFSQWRAETVELAHKIWAQEKSGIWPKHDGANCWRWGECEYHGLCSSGLEYDDPDNVPGGFKYEPFRPWEDWEM